MGSGRDGLVSVLGAAQQLGRDRSTVQLAINRYEVPPSGLRAGKPIYRVPALIDALFLLDSRAPDWTWPHDRLEVLWRVCAALDRGEVVDQSRFSELLMLERADFHNGTLPREGGASTGCGPEPGDAEGDDDAGSCSQPRRASRGQRGNTSCAGDSGSSRARAGGRADRTGKCGRTARDRDARRPGR